MSVGASKNQQESPEGFWKEFPQFTTTMLPIGARVWKPKGEFVFPVEGIGVMAIFKSNAFGHLVAIRLMSMSFHWGGGGDQEGE